MKTEVSASLKRSSTGETAPEKSSNRMPTRRIRFPNEMLSEIRRETQPGETFPGAVRRLLSIELDRRTSERKRTDLEKTNGTKPRCPECSGFLPSHRRECSLRPVLP